MYKTMQRKDWAFHVCTVWLLILYVLSTHHSPVKLLTALISDKGEQNQTPAHHHRAHFFHTPPSPSNKHSCELETASKNPLRYFVGIWRKRSKRFTRAPPVLITILHILGKSQQIWRKKEWRLCNRAAAHYSMSWRTSHQLSHVVSLRVSTYAMKARTRHKFSWNHGGTQ